MQTASASPTVAAALQLTAAAIIVPELADGEVWTGVISEGTKLHHVILLPGDNDDADWNTQMAWAKERGGDLPTRVEQALLFDQHKDQFKSDWYWSNKQHASHESYAWMQGFNNGNQNYNHKDNDYRARAVRR